MDQSIRLELIPGSNREMLVGINGEVSLDSRIIAAVSAQKRLFPYVVELVAINQYCKDEPGYVHNYNEPAGHGLRELMAVLRNELVDAINQCARPGEVVE
jgi:hypothetical protein